MSRLIGQLLQADQRTIASVIQRLESMCLQPGVDTRLTAEIIVGAREKARHLGFDPTDSTKEELYYGLLEKAKKDDNIIRAKLAVTDTTSPIRAAEIIAKNTGKLLQKDLVVCMQQIAVKKLLLSVPPKRTLRALQFRSIESVLKREDPNVLYALAVRIEDKSWHTQIKARMKRLAAKDATEAPVKVLTIPEKWMTKLKKVEFDNIIQAVPEIGSILILPSLPLSIPGSVLLSVSLVLQAGQKMTVESLPYRTKHLSIGYEKLLPEIASGIPEELPTIHGLRPSWHAVFQLLSESESDDYLDFEFMIGDLEWQSTETRLASLSSELDFWVDAHFLGYPTENRPLSFHIIDVAASLVLGKKFENRIVSHLQSSLWNELQLRYLRQENIEKHVVNQLTLAQEVVL